MRIGRGRYQPVSVPSGLPPYDEAVPDLAAAVSPHLEPDPRPQPAPGDRLAAVLALVIGAEEPALLFTERAAEMSRHPGEVSFPGGLTDPSDGDLRTTALRETHEEIGIEPATVAVLGALPPIHTFVSAILVTPFVGTVASLPTLVVSEGEIARVLTVPLRDLAAAEEQRVMREPGRPTWRGWWYELSTATVWGATGAMVHELLTLLRREAAWTIT
jgi:8-oxo-dGTP pyrophosphatase MutT (NUDIX family)